MIRFDVIRLAKLLTLALLGAWACTPQSSDTEPRSESELARQPAESPPAVPELEPNPAPEPEPTPELLPPGTPPVPGFVLYTAEQTIVVPSDGSPRTIGEGLWLQDDRHAPPGLHHTLIMSEARVAILALPRCPCLALAGVCTDGTLDARAFDGHTGALVYGSAQPQCTCMRPRDGHENAEERVASIVAGWLHDQGWERDPDMNSYGATASFHELVVGPPSTLTSDAMRLLGCIELDDPNDDTILSPFVATEPPWPIDRAALVEDCEHDFAEAELFMLRRGDLWEVQSSVGSRGVTRSYSKRPARPDSCPSSNDPCGDPQPYRARAGLDREQREFWIATDGSAALTAEHHSYTLWRADGESVEFELPGIDASTDVIGVRVHADLGPLRALIGRHSSLGLDQPERAPTTVEPQACLAQVEPAEPGPSAREHGEACFAHIGLEEWIEAEAECLRGLAIAEEPGTRGAIFYNLGLIAEAQGAREQAGLYYRESLAVRPGNRTVERRLQKLKLP